MSRKNKLRLAASCAAALLVSQSAHATDYTWTTAATGNWSDASNWTPNTGIPVAGDTATFNAAGVNGAETIFLGPSNVAAATVTFANTGATLVSTGVSGTPVSNEFITLTNGLTVNSSAGAVTVGSNAMNNNVQTVIKGDVTFTNNSSSLLTFDSGAGVTTFSILGDTAQNDNLTTAGTGTGGILFPSSLGKTGSLSLTVGATPGTTGETVELVGSSSTFSGVTVNAGLLTLKSSTALGANTALLTINGGAIAAVTGTRTIPVATHITFGGNATFGASGTPLSGGTDTYGNMAFNGPVDLGGAVRTLTFVSATTFSGTITNGGITKTGSGALSLGNQTRHGNTYAGATTINTGTLVTVGSWGTSENSQLILKNGTTFSAGNGGNQDIGSLSDGGTANNTSIITLGNVNADNLFIGWDNTTSTYSGTIEGNDPSFSGSITKVGNGTLLLSGKNNYNATSRVNAGGTLAINSITDGGIATTVTTTSGSAVATVASTVGITVGMTVDDGNNLALKTTVIGVDPGTNTVTFSGTASAGATQLSNFGTPNSIGLSTNAAAAIVIDGGTLQYVGPAASTDRLFTLTNTTTGALDASGTGDLSLTNAGAVAFSGNGARTLVLTGTNNGANTFAPLIADGPTDGVTGATSLSKTGTGTWVVNGANTYTGATTVSGGTMILTQSQMTTSSVGITGGTLQLKNVGTNQNVIHTPTVTVTAGAMDLTNNKMIVTTTPIGTPTAGVYTAGSVQALVQSGRNGGAWNGSGIVTSESPAQGGSSLTTLAVATASDVGFGGTVTFSGQTVNSTDTLVMYTYAGDMNLDGKINGDDYFRIDKGLTSAATGYENGDLNYDGRIDADDYFIIDKNYSQQTSTFPNGAPLSLGGVAAVPEPASLALLGLTTAGLFGRRRRHH